MQVSYSKDLANHVSPEPHGVCGNAIADALVWESVGLVADIELRNHGILGAPHRPCGLKGKAISSITLMRVMAGLGGVLAPWHALKPHVRESGGRRSRRFPPYTSWNRGIHLIKSPVHRRCLCFDGNDEHENRVHMEWWAGEGVMPYCRFIMPSGR